MNKPLLTVRDLQVKFHTPEQTVHAVRGVDLQISPGERIAVVGESGSGKSQLFHAVMGLLAKNGAASGEILFDGHNLLTCSQKQLNRLRSGTARVGYCRFGHGPRRLSLPPRCDE